MSGHLTIEKIAELRRSLKREAITAEKSGDDHSAAHLRITADLLVKAERALGRVMSADEREKNDAWVVMTNKVDSLKY
tara:strand:+ start:268 stop:501 length:234 start_codon:yes stop_codon:yes gene_type:complete